MNIRIKTHTGEIITGRLECVTLRRGLYCDVVNIHPGAVISITQETYDVTCKHCGQHWQLKRRASRPRSSYCSKDCADKARKMLKSQQAQRYRQRHKKPETGLAAIRPGTNSTPEARGI